MAVSGVSVNSVGYVPSPKVTSPKAPPQSQSSLSTATPAATVEISPQALAAASGQSKNSTGGTGTPPVTTSPTASAPKVNTAKLAIKESNEPLVLLTKQAKHGDQVAKLLLKQIQKKQAAEQSESGNPSSASAVTDDGPETDETSEEHEGAEKTTSAENDETSESAGSAHIEESGANQEANQHE